MDLCIYNFLQNLRGNVNYIGIIYLITPKNWVHLDLRKGNQQKLKQWVNQAFKFEVISIDKAHSLLAMILKNKKA